MTEGITDYAKRFKMPDERTFDDRFKLLAEVAARLTVSISHPSEWPQPDPRPEFLALINALGTEQECQRAYFFLHDWAVELEASAKACSDRAVALGAVNSVDDPRR